jgi:hypothetical protein
MIFVQQDPNYWSEKFNLPIQEDVCKGCGFTFKMDVPIIMQGCAGFATPLHDCGTYFVSVILTPYKEEAKEFWGSVTG